MGFVAGGGVKVGTIEAFGGSSAPDGYLVCDGGAISRTLYSDLFAVIGTTYGTGDGSTTFNLPNYTSARMVTSSSVAIKGTGKTLGLTNGSENCGIQPSYGGTRNSQAFQTAAFNKNVGGDYSITDSGVSKALGVTTDATKSGITGTATLASSCKFIIKY